MRNSRLRLKGSQKASQQQSSENQFLTSLPGQLRYSYGMICDDVAHDSEVDDGRGCYV